jgi:hypothetical protein
VSASSGDAVTTSNATAVAVPGPPSPVPTDVKAEGPAPAALVAVRLPDPAPGFGGRRAPDSVSLTSLSSSDRAYWTADFLVGEPCGHEATVIVGDFPMPATSGIPVFGSSPGPITDHPTVGGRPAFVTHDGDQTILYFSTSRFTVQVVGSQTVTVAELVTLAEALENIG